MCPFKLKYEDSENIKADHVNTVIFNLNQTSGVFIGTPCSLNPRLPKQLLKVVGKFSEWTIPFFINNLPGN